MILEAVSLEVLDDVGFAVGGVLFLKLFTEGVSVEGKAAVLLPVESEGVAEGVACLLEVEAGGAVGLRGRMEGRLVFAPAGEIAAEKTEKNFVGGVGVFGVVLETVALEPL